MNYYTNTKLKMMNDFAILNAKEKKNKNEKTKIKTKQKNK